MGPAVDLDDTACRVKMIVDGVGVGDETALVVGEDVVDGGARVIARVLEEDMSLRRDEYPEVSRSAALLVLYEHAGRVDAERYGCLSASSRIARQVFGERLAASWLPTLVGSDLLLFIRERERGIEIGRLPLFENDRENIPSESRAPFYEPQRGRMNAPCRRHRARQTSGTRSRRRAMVSRWQRSARS